MRKVLWFGFFSTVLLFGSDIFADDTVKEIDFDKGVDTSAILENLRAKNKAAAKDEIVKMCTVQYKSEPIELKAPYKSVRIRSSVKEDCSMSTDSVTYSTTAVSAVPPLGGSEYSSAKAIRSRSPGKDTSYGCTVNSWEKDAIRAAMITMYNHTSWNVIPEGITDGTLHGRAFPNLDWWHVSGKPIGDIGFDGPHLGWSYASGVFYCDGADWCKICGIGSYCAIRLTNDIRFSSGGGCSGGLRVDGQICATCYVDWEIIQ